MANQATVGLLRANLTTNAAEFEGGMKKAAAAAKAFGSSVTAVGKESLRAGSSVERMAKAFSGDRLLKTANDLTAAVQKIGGVTRLTEAEKAKLNATLTKATDKYRALGQQAPAAMVALEKATRRVEQPTSAITSKMVALGAAVGSFVGNIAANAAMRLGHEMLQAASSGVQLASLVTSFDRLAGSIGTTADSMLSMTRSATKGLISDLGIMQAANKGMLLGLPLTSSEMAKLAQTAVVLGKAMGQDAGKSLDDLITALGRSSPLILDNLGLTVKVGEANEAYAASLGKSVSQLTDAEKKMAFYKAAMAAAEAKTTTLGGVQLTLSDHLSRVGTGLSNIISAFSRQIAQQPAVEGFFSRLGDLVTRVAGDMNDMAEAMRRLNAENAKRGIVGVPQGAFKGGGPLGEGRLNEILRQIAFERALATASAGRPQLGMAAPLAALAFDEGFLDFVESKLTKAPAAAVKAMEEAAEKAKRLAVDMRNFATEQFRAIAGLAQVVNGGLPRMLLQENALGPVSPGFLFGPSAGLSQVVPGGALPEWMRLENMGIFSGPSASGGGFLSGLTGGFKNVLQGMTGGGGLNGLFKNLGGSLVQGFGSILSGGLTSLVSGGIGLAVKGLGKLFGFGSEKKEVQKLRDQFLQSAGGIGELREQAEAAGVSLDKVFGAKKVKDFEKAVKDAVGAIDEHKRRQEEIRATIEKYGITVDQLGAKWRNQSLNERAEMLLNDYRNLLEATENIQLSTEKVADGVIEYLDVARRTGAEVPSAMRPIIQNLIDQGLLFDENGNAITELGELGITWAQTMSEGFLSVREAILDLTAAITGIPRNVNVHVGFTADPFPNTGGGPEQFHRGGIVRAHDGWPMVGRLAWDEVPAILQTGERVLNRREAKAYNAGGRGDAGMAAVLAESLSEVRRALRDLPRQTGRAVQDAMVLSGAR